MPHLQFDLHAEIEKLNKPDLSKEKRDMIMERISVAVIAYTEYKKLYSDMYDYSPTLGAFCSNMAIVRPIWVDHYLRKVHLH